MSSAAVIICTRDRPDDLRTTVRSINDQETAPSLLLLVVDASRSDIAQRNANFLSNITPLQTAHLRYPDSPSLPRQRNYGIEHLPEEREIVFFLDDDVTLDPGYIDTIENYLDAHPEVAGVGGYNPIPPPSFSLRHAARCLFLLDHPEPGRVLPSGAASSPHRLRTLQPTDVQWLAGFSMTYRRACLRNERFDDSLEEYAYLEDRDFALRMRQHGRLITHPDATLTHRRSSVNRYDSEKLAYSFVTHRYWLTDKNVSQSLSKLAFWWSVLGSLLATLLSTQSTKWAALRGSLKGIRATLFHTHPLLQSR